MDEISPSFQSVLSYLSSEGNNSGVQRVKCLLYCKECIGWMHYRPGLTRLALIGKDALPVLLIHTR